MIKAEHSIWARLLFNLYINRLLKKSFSNFYLANEPPDISNEKSLIVTPNHVSWWDGFFIDYIARKILNRKMYLMMLESSLKKYWFFKKVGAYSIEPSNPRSIVDTVKYTNDILYNKESFVVTYPQGEIEPFEKRPLLIKSGLKLFVKEHSDNTLVLPIGLKIQYYDKKNPSVICRFGDLLTGSEIKKDYERYIKIFTNNLNELNNSANEKNFIMDLFE